jgi:Transcription factor WhiB
MAREPKFQTDPNTPCARDPELWFPASGYGKTREAKKRCQPCRYLTECLEYAIGEPSIKDGVWGGVDRTELRALRRERKAS